MLHQEITAKGYSGHYQRVKMAIAPLRRGLPIDTPRERLFEHCPELNHAHDLVRQFAAVLDTRDATPLPHWLEQLTTAGLPALYYSRCCHGEWSRWR
ncbi:hypothetical protein ACWCQZ_46440 [Streptomyces sp. NPDC002285]